MKTPAFQSVKYIHVNTDVSLRYNPSLSIKLILNILLDSGVKTSILFPTSHRSFVDMPKTGGG